MFRFVLRRVGAIAVCLSATAVWLTAASGALAAQTPVYVFPSPGSHYAVPDSQIVFRGVPITALGSIQVLGSRSGVHTGQLKADSDRDGGSFLPTQPFTSGETVTVKTSLDISGSASGVFQFTIATPGRPIPSAPLPYVSAGSHGVQHLHSRPTLFPPTVSVTKNSSAAAPGDIFVAPQFGPVQDGPEIFDPNGNLIWFKGLPKNELATDFRSQRYNASPALTWWQGGENYGLGFGEGVIDNASYVQIATVSCADGLRMDLHEFLLTSHNTAWIDCPSPVYVNASSDHGTTRAVAVDSVVQEIDVKTGLLLFEWHPLDHVGLSESYDPAPKVANHLFDFFHANSVALDREGNVVISGRNTWTAYDVNPNTGAVNWRLGGKRSSFKMKGGTSFAYQHNVIVHLDGTITMFDDGASPVVHTQSRALRLELKDGVAAWIGEDEHSPPLLAGYEGNSQLLANGDTFVGWGQEPDFTEFDPHGRTIFDAVFVADTPSYRAYRLGWSGQPQTLPAAAASIGAHGTATVYASWNGATDVVSWRVLAGPSATSLQTVATVARHGFETAAAVRSGGPYFAVQALGSSGQVLATSAPVR